MKKNILKLMLVFIVVISTIQINLTSNTKGSQYQGEDWSSESWALLLATMPAKNESYVLLIDALTKNG